MNNVVELDPAQRNDVAGSRVVNDSSPPGISGGGSEGGDGMEARIAKLESDVTHISSKLDEIGKDVRELRSGHTILFRWGIGACAFLLVAFATGYHVLSTRSDNLSDQVSRSETTIQKQIAGAQIALQQELMGVQVTLQHVADTVAQKKR